MRIMRFHKWHDFTIRGSFEGAPFSDMEMEYNTSGMGTTSIVVPKGIWVRDLAAIVTGKRLTGIILNYESNQSIVCRGQSMKGIQPDFETQGRCHQKTKAVASKVPPKRLMSSNLII